MNHPQLSDPHVLSLIDDLRYLAGEVSDEDTDNADATRVGKLLWEAPSVAVADGIATLVAAARICGRLEEWSRIFAPKSSELFIGNDTLFAWIYCVDPVRRE